MKSLLALCLGTLLLFSAGCDLITREDVEDEIDESNYPTVLYPLSSDSLRSLKEEFLDLNNNEVCLTLDEWGFTGHGFCNKANPGIRITSVDTLITMAKTTLFLNRKFTNVMDTSLIEIRRVLAMPFSDSTEWRIDFHGQNYSDHEVLYTQIFVWMYGAGIYRINGHWYRDMFVPARDKFEIAEAMENIVDLEITWYDFGGNPQVFTVTEQSFVGSVEKTIVPIDKEDSIEIRVTWQIGVSWEGDPFPSWYVYVDTTTGETVHIVQLFVT